MHVHMADGTVVRCQEWREVEGVKAANSGTWRRVTGWLNETIAINCTCAAEDVGGPHDSRCPSAVTATAEIDMSEAVGGRASNSADHVT